MIEEEEEGWRRAVEVGEGRGWDGMGYEEVQVQVLPWGRQREPELTAVWLSIR